MTVKKWGICEISEILFTVTDSGWSRASRGDISRMGLAAIFNLFMSSFFHGFLLRGFFILHCTP
jgi:hypothetical protein